MGKYSILDQTIYKYLIPGIVFALTGGILLIFGNSALSIVVCTLILGVGFGTEFMNSHLVTKIPLEKDDEASIILRDSTAREASRIFGKCLCILIILLGVEYLLTPRGLRNLFNVNPIDFLLLLYGIHQILFGSLYIYKLAKEEAYVEE